MRSDQIRALATACTNLGVGLFLTAIVSPAVNGTAGDVPHIAAWLLFGASALVVSQKLLGRLP
jgi:hypothetical protein